MEIFLQNFHCAKTCAQSPADFIFSAAPPHSRRFRRECARLPFCGALNFARRPFSCLRFRGEAKLSRVHFYIGNARGPFPDSNANLDGLARIFSGSRISKLFSSFPPLMRRVRFSPPFSVKGDFAPRRNPFAARNGGVLRAPYRGALYGEKRAAFRSA